MNKIYVYAYAQVQYIISFQSGINGLKSVLIPLPPIRRVLLFIILPPDIHVVRLKVCNYDVVL